MSVEAIGARIGEIHAKMDALLGSPAPAGGDFAQALQGASATGPTGPVASAAMTGGVGGASSAAGAAVPYAAEIEAAAARHGVDPALLKALIKQESNFDPNARSPAGASGLCQLMPATARGLGVSDPTDPLQAVEGGAKYLRQQLDRFGGDPEKALAAYNAGPGAVQRFGGVPPYAETQNYVRKVLAYAEEFRAAPAAAAPAVPAAAAMASPMGMAVAPAAAAPVASGPGAFGIV